MKRFLVLTGACLLVLAIGLRGIAFSEEQKKDKAPGNTEKKIDLSPQEVEKQKKMAVARVNKTDITVNELLGEMNMIAPRIIKEAGQKTPEVDKKVKETALDILIFRELAAQEALRQGIKIRPEAIAEVRNQLRKSLGSEEKYRNYLENAGYTEEQLNRQIEKDKLFEAIVAKEVFRKVKPDDAAAVEKRKKQWEKGLRKKARIEILLPKIEKDLLENAHKGKNIPQ